MGRHIYEWDLPISVQDAVKAAKYPYLYLDGFRELQDDVRVLKSAPKSDADAKLDALADHLGLEFVKTKYVVRKKRTKKAA